MVKAKVLIVDDEDDICKLISDILLDEGLHTMLAKNSDQALDALKNTPNIGLVLLDIWLKDSNLDGLGVLEEIKNLYPHIPVVMISGHGTISTAVSALNLGAQDYIEKPFNTEKLTVTIKRVLENTKLKRENLELKKRIVKKSDIIGTSLRAEELKHAIENLSLTQNKILIQGPQGSGKELVAKLIHRKSKSKGSFLKLTHSILNTAKMQKDLFDNDGAGLIDMVDNGTLFLYEILSFSPIVQHSLLKLFKTISNENLNIRVIASSAKNLKKAVKADTFSKELYYKISEAVVNVPSLSERSDDIPALIEHFMKYFENNSNLERKKIDIKVVETFKSFAWPGNVRQLKNVIESMLITAKANECKEVTVEMLPSDLLGSAYNVGVFDMGTDIMSMPLREAREVFEQKYLLAQMSRFKNNISKTSSFVGMERSALHRKLKLLNIHKSGKVEEEDEQVAEIASASV